MVFYVDDKVHSSDELQKFLQGYPHFQVEAHVNDKELRVILRPSYEDGQYKDLNKSFYFLLKEQCK